MIGFNTLFRKLVGIAGIAASWSIAWGFTFLGIGLIVGIVRPQDIDPGEGWFTIVRVGVGVGFVSGAIYGTLVAVAENGRSILDLRFTRVTLWGIVAAAAWPVLTRVDDGMVIILCPLGAVCAAVAVAAARRSYRAGSRPSLIDSVSRLLAIPLRAVCAS